MRRAVLTLATLLALLVFSIAASLAGATLRHSDPPPDAMLDRSPMEVMAWFTMPITRGSNLRIFDVDFNDMAKGEPTIDPGDVTLLRLPLHTLSPGKYTVKWRAEGRDGSITEGEYSFNVGFDATSWLPVLVGVGTVAITVTAATFGWLLLGKLRRRY